MRANYHGYFKVESIRTQYSDYASFKIVAPISLKNKLLNKDNWVEYIYICSSILFETSLLLVFSYVFIVFVIFVFTRIKI